MITLLTTRRGLALGQALTQRTIVCCTSITSSAKLCKLRLSMSCECCSKDAQTSLTGQRTEERGVRCNGGASVVPVESLELAVFGRAGQALQVVLIPHRLHSQQQQLVSGISSSLKWGCCTTDSSVRA